MKIGYFLSCEEWGPQDLLEQAVKARRAGFDGLWISDHFHPWNDEQGHSHSCGRSSARSPTPSRAPM